ncbi:YqaJ viral recombinase family nuclease [Dermabacteraceae bacterium P7006]
MNTAKLILPATADGTPEWLAQRTQGFGGTNAAQLYLGLISPFALWREKTGLATPEPVPPSKQVIFDYGHSREPELARIFTARTGLKTRNTGTWARKDTPWMLANPDRLIGRDGLLEIKTAGPYTDAGKAWRAGRVTDHAWVQAHWYALVTGRTQLWFIAEVERRPYILGPYTAEKDLMDSLETLAHEFWAKVQDGTKPALEPVDAALAYPWSQEGEAVTVEPWDQTVQDIERLTVIKAKEAELKQEKELLQNRVKLVMGTAEVLKDSTGRDLATCRTITRTALDKKKLSDAGLDPNDYLGETKSYRQLVLKGAK